MYALLLLLPASKSGLTKLDYAIAAYMAPTPIMFHVLSDVEFYEQSA